MLLLIGLGAALCRPAAAAVSLPDLRGGVRAIPAPRATATVLFFIAHDCPIANGYAPEIQRIAARYAPQGVACYLVYVEPDLTAAGARRHCAAYGYRVAALRDTKHALVRMAGATVTPEAVALSPSGKVLYRGRIDDKYVALGRPRYRVSRHDLRDALDAILQHRPVPHPATTALGCFIPPLG